MSEKDEINVHASVAQVGDGNIQNNTFGLRYPQGIAVEAIEKELFELKATRFFDGAEQASDRAKIFSKKLLDGELAGASDQVRGIALAWCVRILAYSELACAKELFEEARNLSSAEEVSVAEAFILSSEDDKPASLSILAKINTPLSVTASFLVVAHHEGKTNALQWILKAGHSFSSLDSDGRFLFISYLLDAGSWDRALKCLSGIAPEDFEKSPVLHCIVAHVNLALVTPEDIRKSILQHLPIDAYIRLSDDAESIKKRRTAMHSFLSCSEAASSLGCNRAADIASDYYIWLKLRDPELRSEALEELKNSLRDPSHRIRRVPLALQYGIKIDLIQLENEIQENFVRSGGISLEVALVRLAIAFEQQSPKDVLAYIEKYKDQLYQFIDRNYIDSILIEALAKGGDLGGASARLDKSELSEDQKIKLRNIIGESVEDDSVSKFKEQYERTHELSDLVHLVKILEEVADWEQVRQYSSELFKKTNALRDAVSVAFSTFNCHQYEDVLSFLDDNPSLLSQSDQLRAVSAESYYRLGKFSQSKKEYESIKDESIRSEYRELWLNIAISSGDWESLHSYIESEWNSRDSKDASSLIRLAQLSRSIGSFRTQQLVELAVSKAANDPFVLLSAYGIASGSGWEDIELAGKWLNKAIELSTEDGPVQRMSLADIMDRKPAWDEREGDIYKKLRTGEIPLFIAANTLNRSLCETHLLQVLASLKEKDPRRKVVIPAYAGERGDIEGLETVKRLAFDATSLITLGFMGLLEETASSFERIVIPHSTLGWLFKERLEVVHHQPSRIANAKEILRLVQNGDLQELSLSNTLDRKLQADVGEDLACMISNAKEKNSNRTDNKNIVVHPFPVHRIDSLMDEQADLSDYYDLMSSCLSIVDRLKILGHLNSSDELRAKDYLSLHEQEWPNKIDIPDGSILYLDELSVSYFQHLNILEKLSEAGFEAVISSSALRNAKNLVNFENLTNKAEEVIEELRKFLQEGINSGKIEVRSQAVNDDDFVPDLIHHPAFSAMSLLGEVDALAVDDRYFNKSLGSKLLTTQELIAYLKSQGKISSQEYFEAKAKLRNAGYLFVALDKTELQSALISSAVEEGKVIESSELKAIRENYLKAQMSGYLQLPREAFWLTNFSKLIIDQIHQHWTTEIPGSLARARSEWLIQFVDIRGWSGGFDFEAGKNYANEIFVHQILLLLITPTSSDLKVKQRYFDWLEEYFWPDIVEEGGLFNRVIAGAKNVVLRSMETLGEFGEGHEED
jgi:hypothetical protein